MSEKTLFSYSIAFPIVKAEVTKEGNFLIIGDILGTCFSIGGSFMITAKHVISPYIEAKELLVVGIANNETGELKAALVTDIELLDCDIAILKIEHIYKESASWITSLKWYKTQLHTFHPVLMIGYPHGIRLVKEEVDIINRGFQGYVVSNPNKFCPIGYEKEPFGVYELNFQAPAALSGSPLLIPAGKPLISGLIIGNSSTKILVLENEEIIEEKSERKVVQQYESMTLGIAVQQTDIFLLTSKILRNSIGDYLKYNGFLPRE
jgi:hypothetical protein